VGAGTPIGTGTGAAITVTTGATEFKGTVATASGLAITPNVTFRDNVTIAAGDTATTLDGNVVLDGLTFQAGRGVTFGDALLDQVTLSGGPVSISTTANNGS